MLPLVGRTVDRSGVRRSMTVSGLAFGAALVATGGVPGFVTLALAFTGIRMLGQGALSLVSQTGIALWFDRRRDLAIALSMTLSAGLMAMAPMLLTALVDGVGWRPAWVVTGVGRRHGRGGLRVRMVDGPGQHPAPAARPGSTATCETRNRVGTEVSHFVADGRELDASGQDMLRA